MSLKSRPLTPIEVNSIIHRFNPEFAFEVSHPKYIPEYIDRIQKIMLGFHVCTDGTNLIQKHKVEDPIKLPDVNSLMEACDWLGNNLHPYDKSIATIAANDRFIVLCSNHLSADGGLLAKMCQMIQDPNFTPPKLPTFPEPFEHTFAEHFKRTDTNFEYFNPSELTSYRSKDGLIPENIERFARFSSFKEDIKNFQCYDHKTKKCHGITESSWNALTLSMNALAGKLDKIGCVTCTDLRYAINPGIQHQNTFAFITPCAPVSPYQTVEELGKLMRNDFEMKKARGDPIANFSPHFKRDYPEAQSATAEVSLMPPFHIRKPIVDAYGQILSQDIRETSVAFLGFSVLNDDTQQHTYYGRFRSSRQYLNDYDAHTLIKSIHHFLVNIPSSVTVKEAYDELRRFQSKLLKGLNVYKYSEK